MRRTLLIHKYFYKHRFLPPPLPRWTLHPSWRSGRTRPAGSRTAARDSAAGRPSSRRCRSNAQCYWWRRGASGRSPWSVRCPSWSRCAAARRSAGAGGEKGTRASRSRQRESWASVMKHNRSWSIRRLVALWGARAWSIKFRFKHNGCIAVFKISHGLRAMKLHYLECNKLK